jgi:hypothetical protein
VSLPEPETGLVIHYAYLWRSEAEKGAEESRKDRPCAVVVARRIESNGIIGVMVAPITHSAPIEDSTALEIPLDVKRRLGLDDAQSWIITNEMNIFTWPGPDLRAVPVENKSGKFAYGFLPKRLADEVVQHVIANTKADRQTLVQRPE